MNPSRERAGRIHWHAVATGSVFLVAVAAIGDYYGYLVRFGGARGPATFDLTFVSPGEYRLWLVSTLLLIPGSLLVCNGFAGPLSKWLGEAARRLSGLEGRSRWLAGGSLFVGLVVLYRLGRRILLRDHMVTDDETAIRFGGQILAMGQLSVQRLWPPNTFSEIYTAALGDRIFATDWPGALIIAALAEIGPGALVYAFLAAAGCLAVCAAAERIAGRSAGWLAAVIWIVSPMVWTLSVTRHTHLVSRTFIAFAFLACAFLWCDRQQGAEANRAMRFGLPLLLGASVGFAFLCRPVETAAVMAPAGVYLGPLLDRGLFRLSGRN